MKFVSSTTITITIFIAGVVTIVNGDTYGPNSFRGKAQEAPPAPPLNATVATINQAGNLFFRGPPAPPPKKKSIKKSPATCNCKAEIQRLTKANNATKKELSDLQTNFTALQKVVQALVDKTTCIADGSNADDLIFSGCNVHVVNGLDGTNTKNGKGNLIVGYNEKTITINEELDDPVTIERNEDDRVGSHNVVIGVAHAYKEDSGLVLGVANSIGRGSMSGGRLNTASGTYSFTSGSENSATGFGSSVSGGENNEASGKFSSISGGSTNFASGESSSISGGGANEASEETSSISGGLSNIASGLSSSISGGFKNEASGFRSSIPGGNEITCGTDIGVCLPTN